MDLLGYHFLDPHGVAKPQTEGRPYSEDVGRDPRSNTGGALVSP